jgi:putative endonuclease
VRANRRRAESRGRFAETRCAWGLRLKGYRILARRARGPLGEIDIVARRGKTIAFIEVKARQSLDAAMESVSERQQARIRQAAELYLAHTPKLAHLAPRFDVMLVAGWRWPRHIIDAWRD